MRLVQLLHRFADGQVRARAASTIGRATVPASPYHGVARVRTGEPALVDVAIPGLIDWDPRASDSRDRAPIGALFGRGRRGKEAAGHHRWESGIPSCWPSHGELGVKALRGVGKVRLRRLSATTSIRRTGRTTLAARVLLASVVLVAGMAQGAPAAAAEQRNEAQSSTVEVNTVAMPAATFGDGTFHVGAGIQPGTYRTRVAAPLGCYWERLSGFGGTIDEVIANDFTAGTSVVTIAPTDAGFSSSRCGTWTTDLSPIVLPGAAFSEGTFIVGTDLAPGTYQSSSSVSGCYWARLSGFSGALDDIIANDFTDAPAIVTISPTDVGFQTNDGCGSWVSPGLATHLSVSDFPSPTVSGTAHNVTVRALNGAGGTATEYLGRVHFASSDSTAVLPADYTFTGSDAGVHVFSVTLRAFGIHSITVTDTVTGAVTGSQQGISVASNPATYHPISPVRVLDTRAHNGLASRLTANTPATFAVTGRTDVSPVIPAGAVAVTGNVTVVGSSAGWAVYLGPAPIANPTTSAINFTTGQVAGNGLTVALSSTGTLSATFISSGGQTTDLVFDVTGYFTANSSGDTYNPMTLSGSWIRASATGSTACSSRPRRGPSRLPVEMACPGTRSPLLATSPLLGRRAVGPPI